MKRGLPDGGMSDRLPMKLAIWRANTTSVDISFLMIRIFFSGRLKDIVSEFMDS